MEEMSARLAAEEALIQHLLAERNLGQGPIKNLRLTSTPLNSTNWPLWKAEATRGIQSMGGLDLLTENGCSAPDDADAAGLLRPNIKCSQVVCTQLQWR